MAENSEKFCIELPSWLPTFNSQYIPSRDTNDQMQFVLKAAHENVAQNTGGPFAAAVFETESGKLVSLGVNLVTSQQLSILHAEIVALSLAQREIGAYDLGGSGQPHHQLVTSSEPCAMCFGAIPWSGVTRVITGSRDSDVRAIGFDEGPKLKDWQSALTSRGIQVIPDVARSDAIHVLEVYRQQGGHLYNSRESTQ
ncbi:nucleoside deaminase [Aurantivibrio plasticivorans]